MQIYASLILGCCFLFSRELTERSVDPCHCDFIREVAKTLSVPVIAKYYFSNLCF